MTREWRAGAWVLVLALAGCVAPSGDNEADSEPVRHWGLGLDTEPLPDPAPYREPAEERAWWFSVVEAWEMDQLAAPDCEPDDDPDPPSDVLVKRYLEAARACWFRTTPEFSHDDPSDQVIRSLDAAQNEAHVAFVELEAAMPPNTGFRNITTVQMMAHILGVVPGLDDQLADADRKRSDYVVNGTWENATDAQRAYRHIERVAMRTAQLLYMHDWSGPCRMLVGQAHAEAADALAAFQQLNRDAFAAAVRDYHSAFRPEGVPPADGHEAVNESLATLTGEVERAAAYGLWPVLLDKVGQIHVYKRMGELADEPPWPTYEEARFILAERLHNSRSVAIEWRVFTSGPHEDDRDQWEELKVPALQAMAVRDLQWPYANVTCD